MNGASRLGSNTSGSTPISSDAGSSDDDSSDLDDVPLTLASPSPRSKELFALARLDTPNATPPAPAGLRLSLPTLGAMTRSPAPEQSAPDSRATNGWELHQQHHQLQHDPSDGSATNRGGVSRTTSMPAARFKPPRLHLLNPATASPVPTPKSTAQPAALPARPAAPALPTSIGVALLSTAFTFHTALPNGSSAPGPGAASTVPPPSPRDAVAPVLAAIRQRCCATLGVPPSQLRLFEIRELPEGEVPSDCRTLGVWVADSTFSLAALEEMVVLNRHLMATTDKLAGAAEGQRVESSAAAGEVLRQSVRAAELEGALSRERERIKSVEMEREQLREQLAQCEERRAALARTVQTLRKEFDDLRTKCSVQSLVLHALPSPASSERGGSAARMSTMLGGAGGSREISLGSGGTLGGGGGSLSGGQVLNFSSSPAASPLRMGGLTSPQAGRAAYAARRSAHEAGYGGSGLGSGDGGGAAAVLSAEYSMQALRLGSHSVLSPPASERGGDGRPTSPHSEPSAYSQRPIYGSVWPGGLEPRRDGSSSDPLVHLRSAPQRHLHSSNLSSPTLPGAAVTRTAWEAHSVGQDSTGDGQHGLAGSR